jgi:DNA-binding response OmpR family regulator
MKTANLLLACGPARESLSKPINSPPRILLADDDYFLRQLEAEMLRCAGFEVDDVGDGAAAWDMLQIENYDLLITDNNMPLVFGVELLKRIQTAQMYLPVIMATGSLSDWELMSDSFLQPVTLLFKPYTIAELMRVVQEKLRTKTGAGGDAASAHLPCQQPVQSLRI